MTDIDLAKPMHLRAEMARRGIAPSHLCGYWDPERGDVDPLDDQETRAEIRGFLSALWRAAIAAEAFR